MRYACSLSQAYLSQFVVSWIRDDMCSTVPCGHNNHANRSRHQDTMTGCLLVQIFVLKWCAWFLRMKKPGEEAEPRPQCTPSLLSCSSDSEHTTPDRHGSGPNSANGNLLYIGFRGLEELHHTTGKTSDLLHKQPDFPASLSLHSNGVPPSGHSSEPGDPQLEKILEEVQYLADRFRSQDADKAACNE
ncbi:hypothetical protein NDU88_000792 [Pleurodeles waltl]|uniref:Uncharacterized protein n=1 Tax=Pleurodeles waltl TaxID=8319 RepID=A0AAV7KR60_PLEWA|nr:hypothetical protein NDU88_000792 [Pleurodeles waltl]